MQQNRACVICSTMQLCMSAAYMHYTCSFAFCNRYPFVLNLFQWFVFSKFILFRWLLGIYWAEGLHFSHAFSKPLTLPCRHPNNSCVCHNVTSFEQVRDMSSWLNGHTYIEGKSINNGSQLSAFMLILRSSSLLPLITVPPRVARIEEQA